MSGRVDSWDRISVTPALNYFTANRNIGDVWIASTPKQCEGSDLLKQQ